MGLLIVSVVAFILLFVIIFGGRILYKNSSRYDGKPFWAKTIVYSLGSFVAFGILLFGCFTKVDANEVGIIYHDKYGVLEEVKNEGFQTKSIFEHITRISTSNRNRAIKVAGQTSDSAYAEFTITVVYKIEAANAGKFFKAANAKDISDDQIGSIAKEALQSSTIKFDIYSILGDKLEEVRVDFTDNLKEIMMDRYSITVISTSFDDIDAGERIEESIRKKAEALQQVEIAEAERQRAEVEKETARIKAEAEAEAQRIAAKAKAEVIEIEAKAEAERKKIEEEAVARAIWQYVETLGLTEHEAVELYKYLMWLQAWDGDVPLFGDSGMPDNVYFPVQP